MRSLEVGGHRIGPDAPCFIIAEAGVNHNGDVELAKRLIDAAKEADADAVKFQTWVTEKLVTTDACMAEYQSRNTKSKLTQFEMLKKLELSYDQFRELKKYADLQQITFFSTPDEEDSSDFLEELDVPLFKMGSGEVTNLPFLKYVAGKQRPIILSTGMSTLQEVEAAVRAIEESGNQQLVLLHCVSSYPALPGDVNLRAIDTMQTALGYPVGFSDHTMGIEIAVASVARGACVIEKHLTLDKAMAGPDHSSSLDAAEFARMVSTIRAVESALGDGVKRPTTAELETKKAVQKSIVSARTIQAGTTLTNSDLTLRRTPGGLSPSYLPRLLGKRIKAELTANQVVTLDMLT